uniref:Metallothionein-like protein n=1 Tax=Kalanchoe fedtschenkoi TaxID=63787 RepID=A0A7N0TDE9_KALFE
MSSCGCSCGSSCKCNGCGCNSMYPDISETTTTVVATRSIIITGLAPLVNMNSFGGAEMGFAAEDGGCKCGSNCSCDPCNC